MSKSQDSATEEIFPFLRYRYTTDSGQRQNPEDYMINFQVEILGDYSPDDQPGNGWEVHLGDLRATLIRVGNAYNEGFPLIELFDDSQEIHDLRSALFGADDTVFVEPIQKSFSAAFPHEDILYIRRLTVNPIARGQRVGISALHRFMTDWDTGCSLVVLRPLPMQFVPGIREDSAWDDLQLGNFTQDRSEASAKLENHFHGLGFKAVGNLPYMLRSPANMQAPLEELALEDSLTLPRTKLEKRR